jgi:hypothetical protein
MQQLPSARGLQPCRGVVYWFPPVDLPSGILQCKHAGRQAMQLSQHTSRIVPAAGKQAPPQMSANGRIGSTKKECRSQRMNGGQVGAPATTKSTTKLEMRGVYNWAALQMRLVAADAVVVVVLHAVHRRPGQACSGYTPSITSCHLFTTTRTQRCQAARHVTREVTWL